MCKNECLYCSDMHYLCIIPQTLICLDKKLNSYFIVLFIKYTKSFYFTVYLFDPLTVVHNSTNCGNVNVDFVEILILTG